MRRLIATIALTAFASVLLHAQLFIGADTLYGYEWIDYDKNYYRIDVAEDGIYRIPQALLLQQDSLNVDSIAASQYQLWHAGRQVPMYVSTSGPLQASDYLEFYGQRNRSELDRPLFEKPDSMLNPWYSLYTDTAAYYLTWGDPGETSLRYNDVANDLSNPPAPEAWYWGEAVYFFTDRVAKKKVLFQTAVAYSRYQYDGFSNIGDRDKFPLSTTFSLADLDAFSGGPNASLDLRLLSSPNVDTIGHALEVSINGELLYEETFVKSVLRKLDISLPANTLGPALTIKVEGVAGANDGYAIGGAQLRYPRNFNMSGQGFAKLELPGLVGARYLELANMANGTDAVVYDLSRNERLTAQSDGGVQRVRLLPGSGQRPLVAATQVRQVSTLRPHAFVTWEDEPFDYLIVTHSRLRSDVQIYDDYRSSAAGGGYRPLIVEIDELYEQFGYGLRYSPLALRNFLHYARQRWGSLQYVFLMGKGQEYGRVRQPAALQSAVAEGRMLIPSFGLPPSDNLLLAWPGDFAPMLPVGRLAAINGEEVGTYLNKVRAFEANRDNPQTIADRAWMRRIIHLGGGSSATEQSSIRLNLQSMGRVAEQNRFGAEVRAFYKTSTDPLETPLTDQIFGAINGGSSVLTFFGHSSPGTFDFNIDNPRNYDNEGKTMLMLSLGCHSGNIFTPERSIGERFVFLEKRGAVAFGASSGFGFLSALSNFGRSFYGYMGEEFYGRGIGDILRASLLDYSANPSISTGILIEQFTLHGDPALRLHPSPGADYVFDPTSGSFSPRIVTAQQDSLTLSFDILNLGQNLQDTFALSIEQELPDGSRRTLVVDTVGHGRFREAFAYRLPVTGREMIGQNTYYLKLNVDNTAEEQPAAALANNEFVRSDGTAGLSLFVTSNTARPVWPPEYSVVAETPVTLKASTTDALAPDRTYFVQLDTSPYFDSPLRQNTSLQAPGGLIEWQPNMAWQDSTAYFWRISPDSTDSALGLIWESSSFTYIRDGQPGWRQGVFGQWGKNELANVRLQEEEQNLDFSFEVLPMRLYNKAYEAGGDEQPFFFYGYDNAAGSVKPWVNEEHGVSVIVGEPRTANYWRNTAGSEYGSLDPRGESTYTYNTATLEGRQALIHLLTEIVPEDYFVFVFTAQNSPSADFGPQDWAADSLSHDYNLFQILENEGALLVRDLLEFGAVPYSFIYQKGKGRVDEAIAIDAGGVAEVQYFMPRYATQGYMEALVGPSRRWGNGSLNIQGETVNADEDLTSLQIIGLDPKTGQEEMIRSSVEASFEADLTGVDALKYPYLKLRYENKDESSRTMPQFTDWSVVYNGFGDYGLAASANAPIIRDTIQQGEPLSVAFRALSVSGDADSLDVRLSALNLLGQESFYEATQKVWVSEPREIVFNVNTQNFSPGDYFLTVQLNPDTTVNEQHFFNNFFFHELHVLGDKKQPVVDVAFDGRRILDNDIVASNAHIAITLWDENPYLMIDDTSSFEVRLNWPSGRSEFLSASRPEVEFIPASSSDKNKAILMYQAAFEEDGVYELEVRAKDVSQNMAGAYNYKVNFRVFTGNTLSNVLNYPNPFSSSTQFVYTLTGVPPAEFRIQIATVSGRIVKEITQAELGMLQVGTHRTDYRWNGTDDYGDRLANGVYLYRVVAKDADGKSYKAFSEIEDQGIDGYFKNGWGKMVILR